MIEGREVQEGEVLGPGLVPAANTSRDQDSGELRPREINELTCKDQCGWDDPGTWPKGRSGNPNGRTPYTPAERMWRSRSLVAADRKAKVGEDGVPVLEK